MKRMFGCAALLAALLWVITPAGADDDKKAGRADKTDKTSDKGDDKASDKALSAAEFAQKAASSDKFEITSSTLAKSQSKSEHVKKFADHMIADHTKTSTELKALAAKKQLRVVEAVDQKQADMIKKLGALTGSEFDAEYARQQLAAHEMAVALFRAQAKGGDDEDVKAWAEKTLPNLEKHLKHARELGTHAGGKGGKDSDSDKGSKKGSKDTDSDKDSKNKKSGDSDK